MTWCAPGSTGTVADKALPFDPLVLNGKTVEPIEDRAPRRTGAGWRRRGADGRPASGPKTDATFEAGTAAMHEEYTERRRPPDLDQVHHLYCLVGQAVWFLQNVEDAISTSILIKVDLKDAKPRSLRADDVYTILAKNRRLTLGEAVDLTKNGAIYNDGLQIRLAELLEERNWLVHRLVHQNADDMNIDSKRELLFERIDHIADEARSIQQAIGRDLEQFVVSKGMKKEEIDDRAWRAFLRDRGSDRYDF